MDRGNGVPLCLYMYNGRLLVICVGSFIYGMGIKMDSLSTMFVKLGCLPLDLLSLPNILVLCTTELDFSLEIVYDAHPTEFEQTFLHKTNHTLSRI